MLDRAKDTENAAHSIATNKIVTTKDLKREDSVWSILEIVIASRKSTKNAWPIYIVVDVTGRFRKNGGFRTLFASLVNGWVWSLAKI